MLLFQINYIILNFPNRDATFLRNGFVLSQLDGEGMRQMQIQQENASKELFKESLLKQIAVNTGANLSDLRTDSNAKSQTERVTRAIGKGYGTDPTKTETYDMSQNDDDDDFDTPATSDCSCKVNKRIDLDELD